MLVRRNAVGYVLALGLMVPMLGATNPPVSARTVFEFCGTAVDEGQIPEWGPIGIRAKGVSCREAKQVAKAAAKRGLGSWQIGDWSCNYRSRWVIPGELGNTSGTCKRGSQRVKFGWGA